MERIRVLIVGSWLLRDIVEQVTDEHADIEVLQDVPRRAGMEQALRESRATVVICDGRDPPSAAELDALLRQSPSVRILVYDKAAGGSSLWQLRPHERELGELGPDALIAVIRATPTLTGQPTSRSAVEPR